MNNTSILRKLNVINRLLINEAILIKLEKLEINRQDTGVTPAGVTRITPGNSGQGNSVLAVNRVANTLD